MSQRQTLPFVEGFCTGLAAGLALLVLVLANTAHAAPSLTWRRALEVREVSIEVREVTRLELLALLDKHSPRESLSPPKTVGFSLLMRNQRTGAYRCEVYVIDAGDSQTLEHETRHCHGWVHP
jgi:hypothetical protein